MPPKSVLIVEDDPSHRDIIATLLRHHGYGVLEAERALAAVQLALERRPDLVLMDGRLPGVDGWEATRQLKEDPRTADIPVLILSAWVERDPPAPRRVGADGHLVKPFRPAELLAEVRRRIGPAVEEEPPDAPPPAVELP